jgi:hypothetical protein
MRAAKALEQPMDPLDLNGMNGSASLIDDQALQWIAPRLSAAPL